MAGQTSGLRSHIGFPWQQMSRTDSAVGHGRLPDRYHEMLVYDGDPCIENDESVQRNILPHACRHSLKPGRAFGG